MNVLVTEVEIATIKPHDGLIGFASCVLNGQLYVGSIGVHSKLAGGYRLTYPTKKVGSSSVPIFHPINRETSSAIEKAVTKKVETLQWSHQTNKS